MSDDDENIDYQLTDIYDENSSLHNAESLHNPNDYDINKMLQKYYKYEKHYYNNET